MIVNGFLCKRLLLCSMSFYGHKNRIVGFFKVYVYTALHPLHCKRYAKKIWGQVYIYVTVFPGNNMGNYTHCRQVVVCNCNQQFQYLEPVHRNCPHQDFESFLVSYSTYLTEYRIERFETVMYQNESHQIENGQNLPFHNRLHQYSCLQSNNLYIY